MTPGLAIPLGIQSRPAHRGHIVFSGLSDRFGGCSRPLRTVVHVRHSVNHVRHSVNHVRHPVMHVRHHNRRGFTEFGGQIP